MKGFRVLTIPASLANALALFAILIQFTLPLGVAVASGLSPKIDPLQVFDCLGNNTPASATTTTHSCALPGGCCLAPALSGDAAIRDTGVSAASQVVWSQATASLCREFIRHVPWPRGPPQIHL